MGDPAGVTRLNFCQKFFSVSGFILAVERFERAPVLSAAKQVEGKRLNGLNSPFGNR
jgi:hypothetical protein